MVTINKLNYTEFNFPFLCKHSRCKWLNQAKLPVYIIRRINAAKLNKNKKNLDDLEKLLKSPQTKLSCDSTVN